MSKKSHGRAPQRASGKPDPMAGFLNQALTAHQQGQLPEAERGYRYILERAPQHFDALHYFGALKMQQAEYTAGVELIERALTIRSNSPEAMSNLAIGLMRLKRNDEALARLDRSLALSPQQPAAHTNRGLVLAALGRHADAVQAYERALKLHANQVEAYVNLANALRHLGRFDESIAACDRAIALRATYPEAHNNKGLTLNAMRRFEEAIVCYDKAIECRPRYAEAFNNRGNSHNELRQFDAALASYDQALALKPDYAEAQYNRGNTFGAQNRHAEAIAEYDKAIAMQPDHVGAHWNRAISLLLLGHLREGFSEYDWRWQLRNVDRARHSALPQWDGQTSLAGRRIVLWSEQGLGDTIQFARHASTLAARGAQVILDVQPPLRGLLATLAGAVEIPENPAEVQADLQCPLLSLPQRLGIDVHNIPAPVPYLAADDARLAQWRARIGNAGLRAGLRIAICCSGNIKLDNDRNRSIALARFASLLTADRKLFLMQKDCREADLAWLAEHPEVGDLRAELVDFRDTAAALSACDLLISVDTSVAHLAGALGRPVWLLLPFVPDWRWMLDRKDSPWYPSMRLYRQQRAGDWDQVMTTVANDLRNFSA